MSNSRRRAVGMALLAVIAIWMLALAGYFIAKHAKVTADKVRAYITAVDLSKLSAAERAEALRKLADMLNRLSLEERREMRMGRTIGDWFAQMTEEEKAAFIEATLPTGFKQMIAAFEEMPEDKRKRTVDQAMKRLREQQGGGGESNEAGAPPLSPELEAKVRTIGLKSFYSQSSAQTKAELAPLLEEMQRNMESGRPFRGR
ncbi:MAG: hypothetical protein QM813_10330 [Verrucomicrobiota bacterium]